MYIFIDLVTAHLGWVVLEKGPLNKFVVKLIKKLQKIDLINSLLNIVHVADVVDCRCCDSPYNSIL